MPRYINTEDFKHLINASSLYGTKEWVQVMDLLADTPTADVRENVHAKWLPYEFGNERWHKCSACGKADEYINERGIEAVRKFCQNCGAEMRGE